VHYLQAADAHPHDILLCIGTAKAFSDPKRLRYDAKQFFLKTGEEMAEVFKDYPDALAQTMRIAERCDVRIPEGENFLPDFDVPIGYTVDSYFEKVARDGFAHRLPRLKQLALEGALRHTIDEYERRLTYELDMIKNDEVPGVLPHRLGLHPACAREGIPVGPGRGSAAGSLVAYCMRITDVDPIDLRPDLRALPEPGPHLAAGYRHRLLRAPPQRGHRDVTQKYGRDKVAQIITFGTMKAKAVVRDVGRVLEMSFADVDKVAKQIPPALDMTLDKALEES